MHPPPPPDDEADPGLLAAADPAQEVLLSENSAFLAAAPVPVADNPDLENSDGT